ELSRRSTRNHPGLSTAPVPASGQQRPYEPSGLARRVPASRVPHAAQESEAEVDRLTQGPAQSAVAELVLSQPPHAAGGRVRVPTAHDVDPVEREPVPARAGAVPGAGVLLGLRWLGNAGAAAGSHAVEASADAAPLSEQPRIPPGEPGRSRAPRT